MTIPEMRCVRCDLVMETEEPGDPILVIYSCPQCGLKFTVEREGAGYGYVPTFPDDLTTEERREIMIQWVPKWNSAGQREGAYQGLEKMLNRFKKFAQKDPILT